MADQPNFQRLQYEFARHIRDPQSNPAPEGIEDRRMAIYRELFFNNLLKLLGGTFPVLKAIHSQDKWRSMVRAFMIHHRAQTPYFLQIPQEFLEFLENEYETGTDDYPFLLELAHYEWAELALSVSKEENDLSGIDGAGSMLEGTPVKSNLAWLLAYQYPVHRIAGDYLPQAPGDQPTYLAIYRRSDDELGFMELNPVTARLLQMIEQNESQSGRELLQALAQEIEHPDVDSLILHGESAMIEMRDAEILLGSARSQ